MPSVFDEVDAPETSVFDEVESPKKVGSVFDEVEQEPEAPVLPTFEEPIALTPEGPVFKSAIEAQVSGPKLSFPTVPEGAPLAEYLKQPLRTVSPDAWEGGVVRSALPGSLQPEDMLPAVRKIGGELAIGKPGDTHPDIIEREKIPAVEIDQRGFAGPGGKFMDRESAATALNAPTVLEPGRLHSTDLSVLQEPGGFEKQLQMAAEKELHPEPLVTLPKLSPALRRRAAAHQGPVAEAVIETLYDAAKSVPEFFTTEEGMLAGLASMTPLGRLGVESYFTYDMAKSLLDQAKSAGGDWDKLSAPEKAARITQAAVTLGFVGLLAKAGIGSVKGAVRAPGELFAPTMRKAPPTERPGEAPLAAPTEVKAETVPGAVTSRPVEPAITTDKTTLPQKQAELSKTPSYVYKSPESQAWWEEYDRLQAAYLAAERGSPEAIALRKARLRHEDLAYGEGGNNQLAARRMDRNNPLGAVGNVVDSQYSTTNITPTDLTGWRFVGDWFTGESGRQYRRVESPDGKTKKIVVKDSLHPLEEATLNENTSSGIVQEPVAPAKKRTLTPAVREDANPDVREVAGSHGEAILKHAKKGRIAFLEQNKGYVDENGNWLSRTEAIQRFRELTGKEPLDPNRLTSEDFSGVEDIMDLEQKPAPKVETKLPTATEFMSASDDAIKKLASGKGFKGEDLTKKLAEEMTEDQLKAAEPVILDYMKRMAKAIEDAESGKITPQEAVNITMERGTKGKVLTDVFARLNRKMPELPKSAERPAPATGSAARLQQLKGLTDRTPEETAEMQKLQATSDAANRVNMDNYRAMVANAKTPEQAAKLRGMIESAKTLTPEQKAELVGLLPAAPAQPAPAPALKAPEPAATVPQEVLNAAKALYKAEKRYRRARRQEPSDVADAEESRLEAEGIFRDLAAKNKVSQEQFDRLLAEAKATETEVMAEAEPAATEPAAPAAEAPKAIPPRSLPAYGISSKDIARQYGMPEDFYGTGDETGMVSSKYRTPEYDAAVEAEKWVAKLQGINATTIRRQARERTEAEFRKIVEAARAQGEAPKAPAAGGKVEAPITERPKKSPEVVAAEDATQAAFEKLGAAEKGAYDKSKRKGMTKPMLSKLAAFDKLVEAEKAAKAAARAPKPPAPAAPQTAAAKVETTPPPTSQGMAPGPGAASPQEFAQRQAGSNRVPPPPNPPITTEGSAQPTPEVVRQNRDYHLFNRINSPQWLFYFGRLGQAAKSAWETLVLGEFHMRESVRQDVQRLVVDSIKAIPRPLRKKGGKALFDALNGRTMDEITAEWSGREGGEQVIAQAEKIKTRLEEIRTTIRDIKRDSYNRYLNGLNRETLVDLFEKNISSDMDTEGLTKQDFSDALTNQAYPDDWGIADGTYLPHLFFGQWKVTMRMPGDTEATFVTRSQTIQEAKARIYEQVKDNPDLADAQWTIEQDTVIPADMIRLGDRRFWNMVGKMREANVEPEAIRDALRGNIGRAAGRQKWFGSLLRREGFEGYSTDYARVMTAYLNGFHRWRVLTEVNRQVQPLIERVRQEGRYNAADRLQALMDSLWGKPPESTRQFDAFIRTIPYVRDLVKPMALDRWSRFVTQLAGIMTLRTLRFSVVNRLQPLQGLWPIVGERILAEAKVLQHSERGRQLLDEAGVRLDPGQYAHELASTASRRAAVERFSGERSNQELAFLAMYLHARKLGISHEQAIRYGKLRGQLMTQFTPLTTDTPQIMAGPFGRLFFQFKRFPIKQVELIAHMAATKNVPGLARMLAAFALLGGLSYFIRQTWFTDPEKRLRLKRSLDKSLGRRGGDLAMYGLPGFIGADISGSITLGDEPMGRSAYEKAARMMTGPAVTMTVDTANALATEDRKKLSGIQTTEDLLRRFPATRPLSELSALLRGDLDLRTPDGETKLRRKVTDVLMGLGSFRSANEANIALAVNGIMSLAKEEQRLKNEWYVAADKTGARKEIAAFNQTWPEAAITTDDLDRYAKYRDNAKRQTDVSKIAGKRFRRLIPPEQQRR